MEISGFEKRAKVRLIIYLIIVEFGSFLNEWDYSSPTDPRTLMPIQTVSIADKTEGRVPFHPTVSVMESDLGCYLNIFILVQYYHYLSEATS